MISRKRLEIAVAAILVAAYVAVPFVLLPNMCRPMQNQWTLTFWCESKATDFFVGLFTLLLGIATYFLWRETERLARGADDQADKMERSIAEAARAATAMQGVATSMATNVERLKDSLVIQREIADRQKIVTELQSRAYLSIAFWQMVPQNPKTKIRFEPRIKVVNLGNTPAYNVKFCTSANVLAFPLPSDFNFPLPEPKGTSSFIGARTDKILSAVVPKIYPDIEAQQIKEGLGQRIFMWGYITYDDAFGIHRFVRFGQSYFMLADGSWMSNDTALHNNAD